MNYTTTKINDHILKIDEFGLGTMYFIQGSKQNALIDMGTGIGSIKDYIESLSDKPYVVIATHGHVDHVGGMHQFDKVYMHPLDHEAALKMTYDDRQQYAKNILDAYPDSPFSLQDITDFTTNTTIIPINEGDLIDLGDRQLKVFHTPGHTPGSICLLDKQDQILFSGDHCQHLELLMMPGNDRLEVVKRWLEGLEKLKQQQTHFNQILGGHEPLEYELLDTLILCAKKILNQDILPTHKKVHIFEGDFATYKNVNVTYMPTLKTI